MSKRAARVTFFLLMAGCLWWFSGCSSGEEKTTGEGSAQASVNPSETSAGKEAAANESPSNPLIHTGPNGRKMFVDIPMEVWIDDPLAVVAKQGTVAAATPSVTPGTAPNETPTPEPSPATSKEKPAAGGMKVAWDKVIPMPILDAEVKGIQNDLGQIMQSIGSYNATFRNPRKDIPLDAATLIAMAQIAERHPGETLWKKNAPALRELGVLFAEKANKTGRESYSAAQLEFEKIQGIFNGTTPELSPPPEPRAPFGDKAEMIQLMYRMEKAYKYLDSNTPTAAALTGVKEKVTHEVTILGALLNVIRDPSYIISDDEKYQGFAKAALDNVQGMEDGITNNDFDLFKKNLGTIYAKCNNCHTEFK